MEEEQVLPKAVVPKNNLSCPLVTVAEGTIASGGVAETAQLATGHLEQLAWLSENAAATLMDEGKAAELAAKIAALK